jgi:hypothetical protein
MKIELHKASGESECLVQTPKWDFEWQRIYSYDAEIADLPTIGQGDELHMRCTYNNTLSNPFVADALEERGLTEPTTVVLGDETLDEMCLGAFGVLFPAGVIDNLF